MARINNLSNFLTDVADAIKEKKGSETAIPAANFDIEILALPSQGVYEQRVLNISANGSQTITPSTGFDAIDELVLTIAVPEKQLQAKSYEFTQNTNIVLQPETGYDGFTSVGLTINVPGATINNQNKTITENGSYTADQGYTGIGTATVNVPITGTSEYDSDLLLSQQILGGSALPYTELEYIESTGTQYIDTGILPANVDKIITRFSMSVISGVQTILGARYTNNRIVLTENYVSNYNFELGFGSNWVQLNDFKCDLNTPYTITFNYKNSHQNILVDGVNKLDTDYSITLSNFSNFYIFAVPYNEQLLYTGSVKIYNCKFYLDEVLVRDFIPVKRKSDNEICLYDKVTNAFFTNAGTGSFIAGPEIN